MSCGAFGGPGSCGGGGGMGSMGGIGGMGGMGGMGGGFVAPRRFADRKFFDPFCMPLDSRQCEPSCYFNPFVHAQCLGVDMNMQGFRNDILKCQEDYKKAVWAVLKKYAVGEGNKGNNSNSANSNGNNNENDNANISNRINKMMAGFDNLNKNGNNMPGFNPNQNDANMMNIMDMLNPDVGDFFSGNPTNARRSKSSGFQFDDPRFSARGGMGGGIGGCGSFRNQLPM